MLINRRAAVLGGLEALVGGSSSGRAGVAALVKRAQRFGSIFDDVQFETRCCFKQRVHVDRMAEGVHWKTGSNAAMPNASSALAVVVDQSVLGKPSIQCRGGKA